MKKSIFRICWLVGMAIAIGLSGCIISASPNPLAIVEMRPGETKLFEVKGPVNTSMTRCVWSVGRMDNESISNPEYSEEVKVLGDVNKFEFTADPNGEKTNRIRITCSYWSYQYIVPIFCPQMPCKPYWDWVFVNSVSWDIRILQDIAPVWQGNYFIENSRDVELLKNYTAVAGSLVISGKVKSLKGLESLTLIGRTLSVSGSYKKTLMTNLSGLQNIRSVGGDLQIDSNEALKSLSGLQNIQSIGGDLEILRNTSLTDLSSLDGLMSVGGDLNFMYNDALTSLAGLENITSINGSLYIYDNNALANLSGIQNLTSIEMALCIRNNCALTSLGMTGLKRIGSWFDIYNNPMLCTSFAEEFMNQVLVGGGIGGERRIEGNKDCTTP